jgi:hypothetical protein
MDPDDPTDAHQIVSAYMTRLEQDYGADEPFPLALSTLPYSKHIIPQSMKTMVGSLTAAGQLTPELHRVLEIAYMSLADYVDDELVRVMREYRQAMSELDVAAGSGQEKTGTAAWRQIAETSSLVAGIAKTIADEAETLHTEFQQFATHTAAEAPQPT